MQQKIRILIVLSVLLITDNLFGQKGNAPVSGVNTSAVMGHHEVEAFLSGYLSEEKLQSFFADVNKKAGVPDKEKESFTDYLYSQKLRMKDIGVLVEKVENGSVTENNIRQYLENKKNEYAGYYKEYLGSGYAMKKNNPVIVPPALVLPGCTNVDFEMADLTGWTCTHDPVPDLGGYGTNNPTLAGVRQGANNDNTIGGNWCHTIMTAGSGNDAVVAASGPAGTLPRVCPWGGTSSIRLGNRDAKRGAERITQTFTVNPANPYFVYSFAVVLWNGGHAPVDQPYFKIRMYDQANNVIACASYDVNASNAAALGFTSTTFQGENLLWKNWSSVTIPLDAYVNTDVTIEFTTSDCANVTGSHFGYAYIDCSCIPPQIIASVDSACANQTVALSSPASPNYSWAGPGIVGPNNTQSITVNATGTYTVTLQTFTTPPNIPCVYTLTKSVTFFPLPTVTVSPTSAILACGGGTAVISATAGGGNPGYSYSWNNGGTSTSVTVNTAGNYVITVTDTKGCTKTASSLVTNATAGTATVTKTNVVCSTPGSATVTVTGGGLGPFTYSWNTTPVQTTPTATNLSAGSYTVLITDANNCAITKTVTITGAAVLSGTVSTTQSSCGNSNGSATVSASGGTGSYTYLWNPSSQNTQTANGLGAGIYTVTVTDASGCTKLLTATITNSNGPTITMAQTDILCNGLCTGDAAASVSGGISPYTFLWSTGQTTSSINSLCANTYSVLIADAVGCSNVQEVIITEPDAISASMTSTQSACGSGNGTTTAFPSGGTGSYSYLWNPSSQVAQSATGLSPGNYAVTISDANGCSSTFTVNVNGANSPTVALSQNNVSCNGQCTGSASATVSGGISPYTYFWSTNQTTSGVSFLCAQGYTVVVTDNSGCSSQQSISITQPTALTVTVNATPAFCGNNNGSGTASPSGGAIPYTYTWSNSQTAQSATGLGAGTYTVVITDANSCTTTATTTVSSAANTMSATVDSNATCNGGSNGSVTVNPQGGSAPYTYIWNNGQTGQTATNLAAGNYSVLVTDANGCTNTEEVMVGSVPGPTANFSADPPLVDILNPAVLFIDQSLSAVTWFWDFGDGDTGSVLQNPSHVYLNPGTYTVTLIATNAAGCVDTITEIIIVEGYSAIYVPNAFTPNGNGLNDVFAPKFTRIDSAGFSMYIFDRWGNELFHTEKLSGGFWDGRVKEKSAIAQEDVYVYVINCRDMQGKKYNLRGRVSLLK